MVNDLLGHEDTTHYGSVNMIYINPYLISKDFV